MSEIQSMNHDGLHRSLADKILVLGGKPGKDSGAPVLRHILQDGVLAVAAESGLSTEIVSEQKPVVVVYVGIGAKGHLRKHLRRDFPCQSQGMAGAEKQVFRVFNHLAAVPAVFADPLQGGGRVRLIFLADREQADVNPVLLHFVNDLAAPTFVEQQIDVGVPVLQAGDKPRGEKIAHGGGALYVYLPGNLLQRGGFLPAVHHLKNDLYVPVNPLAIGGELDAAARPPQQLVPQLVLQGVDHLTDRGLGGVELVSRFCEGAVLHYFIECDKLFDAHSGTSLFQAAPGPTVRSPRIWHPPCRCRRAACLPES